MNQVRKEENANQSIDNSNESKDKEKKAFSNRKNTKNKLKKHLKIKKASYYFVTGIIILAVFSLYYILNNSQENVWLPQLKWFPVQNSKSIKFEPFIVPFKANEKFTYISLSISFELPNKELMDEMIEKNNWIRGVIYNILNENIYVLENISSLMKLKRVIINRVNDVLSAGEVEKAIITDFSTV